MNLTELATLLWVAAGRPPINPGTDAFRKLVDAGLIEPRFGAPGEPDQHVVTGHGGRLARMALLATQQGQQLDEARQETERLQAENERLYDAGHNWSVRAGIIQQQLDEARREVTRLTSLVNKHSKELAEACLVERLRRHEEAREAMPSLRNLDIKAEFVKKGTEK